MCVPVRITESDKGHRRLIYGENVFIKHAEKNGKIHWKCLLSKSHKCRAKMSTVDYNRQTAMVKQSVHSHGLEAFKKKQLLLNKHFDGCDSIIIC